MTILTIECPKCGNQIEVTEDALTGRIRQNVLNEVLPDIENQKRELEKDKRDLVTMRQAVQEAIDKGVDAGIENARKDALIQAREEVTKEQESVQLELRATIETQESALSEKKDTELELRRERAELKRQLDDQDIVIQRAVDTQVGTIREEFDQKNNLRESEYKIKKDALEKKVDELQKQIAQGSNQLQGEALEVDMEAALRTAFQNDVIEPIQKGVRGADCIQRVTNTFGVEVGSILWESKNTKTFSPGWIQTLKDNVIRSKSEVGVILSLAMPKDITTFGRVNGVWVTSYPCFIPFASMLRGMILKVASERNIQAGKKTNAERLYDYINSAEFGHLIDAVAGPFQEMQRSLTAEKTAMNKIWATRDKQLERVLDNIGGLVGSIQGLTDKPLAIETLELKALPESIESV